MNQPLNLINRLLDLHQIHSVGMSSIETAFSNSPAYAAIPGLDGPIKELLKMNQKQHDAAVTEQIHAMYAILNNDGPIARATRLMLKTHARVQPLPDGIQHNDSFLEVSPRVYFSIPQVPVEDIRNAQDLYYVMESADVLGPVTTPWGGDLGMFAGILPGEFVTAHRDTRQLVRVRDMFPINREPFDIPMQTTITVPLRDQHSLYGGEVAVVTEHRMRDGDAHRMTFTLMNFKEKAGNNMFGGDSREPEANVRITYEVNYQGLGYGLTSEAHNAITGGRHYEASSLFAKITQRELEKGPGHYDRDDLPEHYRVIRELDHRVAVFNSVENTWTYGTTGMIPAREAREALRSYFKMIGVLQKEDKIRSPEELGNWWRDYYMSFKLDESEVRSIRTAKDYADGVERNCVKIHAVGSEQPGPTLVTVTLSIFDFDLPEFEVLRTHAPRPEAGLFRNHPPHPAELYQFGFYVGKDIKDRGLIEVGDYLLTLRTQHYLTKAIEAFFHKAEHLEQK